MTEPRVDPELEPWIESFSTESQVRLRADLERYGTYEQQALFARNVQIDRLKRIVNFANDLLIPFHVKAWRWIRSFFYV